MFAKRANRDAMRKSAYASLKQPYAAVYHLN